MKSILVVDNNKISILMSVEACKDVVAKASIMVSYTGADCLDKIKHNKFDLVIVDFELPDCDGVSLIKEIKKNYSIPTFLTAFPDPIVINAINKELFWYEDVAHWIRKPLEYKKLKKIIEEFVFEEKQLTKMFKTKLDASISIYENKAKKSDISSKVLNMTIKSMHLKYSKSRKFSKNEQIIMRLYPKIKDIKLCEEKGFLIRATVFWVDLKRKELGLFFRKLSLQAQKNIELILKNSTYIESVSKQKKLP